MTIGDRFAWLCAAVPLVLPRVSVFRLLQVPLRALARRLGGTHFRFTSADGLSLEGLYLPALVRREGALPVVLAHGYLEVKELHLRQAQSLRRAGHDVLLFDQRGHGRSQGRNMTFGHRESGDVTKLIDAAEERGWLGGRRVLTLGMSLGGATVLLHAAKDSRVAGVAAMAPFCDAWRAIRHYHRRMVPMFSERWVRRTFAVGQRSFDFDLREASPLAVVGRVRAPMLLVVGTHDGALPGRWHVDPLVAAKPAGGVAVFRVWRANHFNLVTRTWPGMYGRIEAFFRGCEGEVGV